MLTPVVQRWRAHRASYRPAGEPIATAAYEVAPIPDDTTAKAFVLAHHYSRSYPAARFRYGLWHRSGALAGVAVFSVPVNAGALARLPDPGAAVELGRLVLLDEVPANGESWFVARCFADLARAGISGVVSFSDPVPRTDAAGVVVMPGHAGTVYQALGAAYLGRSSGGTRLLLPDGTMLPPRAIAKVRAGDRGWRYAVERLVAAGAAPLPDGADRAAWLARELPAVTRPLAHGGNHRYLFGTAPAARRALERTAPSLPYPKLVLERPGAPAWAAA